MNKKYIIPFLFVGLVNSANSAITVPSLNASVGSVIFDSSVLVTPSSFIVQIGGTPTTAYCYSTTLDDSENLYCAGYTTGDLGEENGGDEDAFVMKLDSSGKLKWVTQLGIKTTGFDGGDNSLSDYCDDVAVDNSGNVYCAGYTEGALGEANGGNYDAFVMKLNANGVIQWITQLGIKTTGFDGGDNSLNDYCDAVAVDNSENVYCAGYTEGALGEANGGNYDSFVMKLNANGVIQWVTQLGDTTLGFAGGDASGSDYCDDVTLDDLGYVYCTGYTTGNFGKANGGNYYAFVMKLNLSGVIQRIKQFEGPKTRVLEKSGQGPRRCGPRSYKSPKSNGFLAPSQ